MLDFCPNLRPVMAAVAGLAVVSSAAVALAGPVRGQVLNGETLRPQPGVTVSVNGTDLTAVSDRRGRFRFEDVPNGNQVFTAGGLEGFEVIEEFLLVEPDEDNELVILILPTGSTSETIEVVGRAPVVVETPGQTELERVELVTMPGTRGDALQVVKTLPGVANADAAGSGPGLLVIRGAAPEDSVFLLDGIEIPIVYHFFGLQSVLPSEFIDDIEFLPGGFGVEYGRATGGIIQIHTRPSRSQEVTGFAEVSFINLAAYLEGPVWKKQNISFSAAVRRSAIDFVLPAVIPEDANIDFLTAPTYYDGQLRVDWLPNPNDRVSFLFATSFDQLSLLSANENANDPDLTGQFDNRTGFTRALFTWDRDDGVVDNKAVAAVGTGLFRVEIGDERFLSGDDVTLNFRDDFRYKFNDLVTLKLGGDAYIQFTDFAASFVLPPAEGEPPDNVNISTDPEINFDEQINDGRYAGWAGVQLNPLENLEVTGGLRYDYYSRIAEGAFAPRLNASYRVNDELVFRGAVGRYSRPLQQAESVPRDLKPEIATQYVLGGEYDFGNGLQFVGSGFFTARDQLVTQDDSQIMEGGDALDAYVNTGTGDSIGVEGTLRARTDNFFGWIAYTLSRSERRDFPDSSRRLFDFDQTHNFIILGSYQLGKWRFGGRWQYTTGQPDTPIVGSTYLSDLNIYVPRFGPVNSDRIEDAHQLDIRIDREFEFDSWKLSAYLDVTNVYAHAQTLGYQYSFDFSEREAFETLPIFPALGVRGTF